MHVAFNCAMKRLRPQLLYLGFSLFCCQQCVEGKALNRLHDPTAAVGGLISPMDTSRILEQPTSKCFETYLRMSNTIGMAVLAEGSHAALPSLEMLWAYGKPIECVMGGETE